MYRRCSLLAVLLFCTAAVSRGDTVRGLGTPSTYIVQGLSGDGSTVYGDISSPTVDAIFRWDLSENPELITNLPANALGHIRPIGISYDGSKIVGEYLYQEYDRVIPPWNDIYTVRLYEAFVYSANTQSFQTLGFLDASAVADDTATAVDISEDGSVAVGSTSSANGKVAFRWTAAGGMQALPHPSEFPGKYLQTAQSVSADGNVAVGSVTSVQGSPGPTSPVAMWTADEGTFLLDDPDGSYFHANTGRKIVSANGSTVIGDRGRLFYPGAHAWRWTKSTGALLLDPNAASGDTSQAVDVSGDGSVIVGSLKRAGRNGPMIWDEQNGARFLEDYFTQDLGLNLTGWSLSKVIAISDDGQTFLGQGTNPHGQFDYWLVSPGLAGDFNGNGIVDGADYVVWRKGLSTIYTQDDFNIWRANVGNTLGSGSTSAQIIQPAVPEPTAVPFACWLLGTLVFTGRRR